MKGLRSPMLGLCVWIVQSCQFRYLLHYLRFCIFLNIMNITRNLLRIVRTCSESEMLLYLELRSLECEDHLRVIV